LTLYFVIASCAAPLAGLCRDRNIFFPSRSDSATIFPAGFDSWTGYCSWESQS